MMVKVCGMRDPDNIRAVEALRPDLLGFIFYPPSPRRVLDEAAIAALPKGAKRAGVFVDAEMELIADKVAALDLDCVQLHGAETPDYCRRLREMLPGSRLIKAFGISCEEDLSRWRDYAAVADFFLFDAMTPGKGGSGRTFDWSLLGAYDGDVPFLLSGGIGPSDAARLRSLRHPAMAGVDLNSRFEMAPGMKDTESLRRFMSEYGEKEGAS